MGQLYCPRCSFALSLHPLSAPIAFCPRCSSARGLEQPLFYRLAAEPADDRPQRSASAA